MRGYDYPEAAAAGNLMTSFWMDSDEFIYEHNTCSERTGRYVRYGVFFFMGQ